MERLIIGQIFLVGMGGFIGSALRFLLRGWVQRLFPYSQFPYGTLAVNVAGCLLIGFLGGLAEERDAFDPGVRLFVLIGVLGGFTTFSTFAFENLLLLQESHYFKALLNTVLQVVVGFTAAWLGLLAARAL